jgi:hypothetical protein
MRWLMTKLGLVEETVDGLEWVDEQGSETAAIVADRSFRPCNGCRSSVIAFSCGARCRCGREV